MIKKLLNLWNPFRTVKTEVFYFHRNECYNALSKRSVNMRSLRPDHTCISIGSFTDSNHHSYNVYLTCFENRSIFPEYSVLMIDWKSKHSVSYRYATSDGMMTITNHDKSWYLEGLRIHDSSDHRPNTYHCNHPNVDHCKVLAGKTSLQPSYIPTKEELEQFAQLCISESVTHFSDCTHHQDVYACAFLEWFSRPELNVYAHLSDLHDQQEFRLQHYQQAYEKAQQVTNVPSVPLEELDF